MILFDIDGTLSPTQPKEAPPAEGETARAGGFNIFVPQHLLDFLRAREDVVLLSTWDLAAFDVLTAFSIPGRVAYMGDFSDKLGIQGKFEVVKQLKPSGWADDHISRPMKKYCEENGIVTTIPKKGYVTEAELKRFERSLEEIPPRKLNPADDLIRLDRGTY